MRDPDVLPVAKSSRRGFIRNESDGARAECARSDERAIRGEGRRRLRAGSESARFAYCAVRQQSDRRPAGKTGRQSDDGKVITRTRIHERNSAETFLGERSGVSVSALRGFGYFARAGNEIDGRSNGHRYRPGSCVCEIADGRAASFTERRKSLRQRQRRR